MMNSNSNYKNDCFDDDTYLVNFRVPSSSSDSNSSTPPGRRMTSNMSSTPNFTLRNTNSEMIIEVKKSELEKAQNKEGTISVTREAQHFCETTTMHGPKRIFKGKKWAHLFWLIIVFASLALLITQVVILVRQYLSKPIVSDVSFILKEKGMSFPLVTFCNFNPIRKSYVKKMNATGDVEPVMLKYLMNWNTEVQRLDASTDRQGLHEGDDSLNRYQNNHTDFTPDNFFMDAGFQCDEVFKYCAFEGERFNCCNLAVPILTPLGKCYTIDMSKSRKPSMHSQNEPGISNGLEVILDAHLEEQFDEVNDTMPPLFTNSFVDGYRYFVHPENTIPHLSSDEFTVSPNSVAYSAISTDRYILLPTDQWGNCTTTYPKDIPADLPYSLTNCMSLCRAKHFFDSCGCSPSIYNLEQRYPECTPFDTQKCVDAKMREKNPDSDEYELKIPACETCTVQCNSLTYRSYNSYGSKFSRGALTWLKQVGNNSWTFPHMETNFQMVSVFYREMSYTEYNQVQDASITQLLSDIGGNMGMFAGMSVITITEICLFFSKVLWIGASKKRRGYMFSKKINEKTHAKEIDLTVEKMKEIGSEANLKQLARIQSNGTLRDQNDNEKVEFRINIQDLADHMNNGPSYIRTDVGRRDTPKY